jgi:hypothetical protein
MDYIKGCFSDDMSLIASLLEGLTYGINCSLVASFDDEKVFLGKGTPMRGIHVVYFLCNKD